MSTNLHLKAAFEILCYSAKEVSSQETLEAAWISSGAEAFGVGGNLLSSFTKMWAHQSGKRPRECVCVWSAEQKGSRLHSSAGPCGVCWNYSLFVFIFNESQPSLNARDRFFQCPTFECFCQLNANLVNRNAVCDFLSASGWVVVFFFHSNLLFTQRLFLVIKLFKWSLPQYMKSS